MSKAFAEKIIDSMVDENGNCGERGLSAKQFTIITEAMMDHIEEDEDAGYWEGDYATIHFWSVTHTGNVGKYRVTVNEHKHFNLGHNVVEITLRDADEYEAELEQERRRKEMLDFSNSSWVAEPKKRINLKLTLVNVYEYEGISYSYYGSGTHYIYTFRDGDGNCIVWKTQKPYVDYYDKESDEWIEAEVGDKVEMRATVKEHGEYRGNKQTVITRPQIKAIA